LRLRALGSRVVPHAADELPRLDAGGRRALLDVLSEIQTGEAKALMKRLLRAEPARPSAASEVGPGPSDVGVVDDVGDDGTEAKALETLRALPPPHGNERAAISRERGEAHLALARTGSRLARKDLLASLTTLEARRTRLYCEAAGLIGDAAFLAPLARIAPVREEATKALAAIAIREKITARSKVLRNLDESLRPLVARAIVGSVRGEDWN